jgi:membrane protein required for colicin V production
VPFIKQYIPASSAQDTIALVASIAALFLGTLIIVSIVTARISDFVLDSRIGALDRTLGFVFGAARGLLLAVIGYLFFAALVGNEKMPVWAKEAKAKPMLEETGRSLIAMLPQDVNADFIKNLLKKPVTETAPEAPAEEPRTPATPAPVAPAPARP